MKKLLLRIFLFLFIASSCFVLIFTYKIFSEGNKIFISKNDDSILKQFEQLVFNPSKKLKGEDDNRINILFLGIGGKSHNGGGLTDTIIILSIKPHENEAAILSIPRDLYVNIPKTNMNTKINAVKLYGDKRNNDGISLIRSVVKEISNLDIHYFVQLDFQGFIKIVDDLGGIDVYLENDINDPSYPNFTNGYDPFYISKGWQHLDGQTALKVARSRHSRMGDFDRIQRQQKIIKSIKQKIFEKYAEFDILTFSNILSSLSENMLTDIELKEIPKFYKITKEIKNHKITADVIDTKKYLNRTYVGMGYTLQAKDSSYNQIKDLSENIFDIEISEETVELIKKEGANIEIRNGTGTLDLANKVAQDLEELEYKIINSTNIELPEFHGVQIYDNSKDQKPETLDFLKEKFNAVIIGVADTEDEFSKADFVIVLGRGF
ncbi:MAG: LCP family protein [Candidatus Pacebacteria bacterium]|nr:LCP family protein [Candidatus Paceibacterota bacterium]